MIGRRKLTVSKPLELLGFLAIFIVGYSIGFFSTTQPKSPELKSDQTDQHSQFRTDCSPRIPPSEIRPMLLNKIYNNITPYENFPPPHVAPALLTRRVRGWGSTATVFAELVESTQPKTIIEVGTFLGASALHMANLTRDLDTVILCLDDFRGWPGFRELHNGMFKHLVDINGDVILMQQFIQNVLDAGEERRVLPVPFSTGSALAAFCEWGVYADLVEVDAGHDFHSAWADINQAWPLVAQGGVMFGHDYNLAADDHGVRRAVNLFADEKGLKVQPHGQHWVLPPKK
ncbi:hypothetical protein ZOSMA_49G00130 [Zostera marina]|uniref:S-adenosyl-L-methionine-dependent methyltransferase n=1 Tax=Zostera marina TaxID=29655 RepID=A0A0K9P154_ZOSMR|nr:hypothetical protein ZOSMA_49G00130 [Zostera marina]